MVNTAALGLTADIIVSHVGHNQIAADALPDLIQAVYRALTTAGLPDAAPLEKLSPAVPIKRSVFPDYLVCLEDGKKLKTLKRYLSTAYGLTPLEYRAKWGLPRDYPMVAPNYAITRSSLAKSIGLGRKRKAVEKSADEPQPIEAVSPSLEPEVTIVKARRARGSRG